MRTRSSRMMGMAVLCALVWIAGCGGGGGSKNLQLEGAVRSASGEPLNGMSVRAYLWSPDMDLSHPVASVDTPADSNHFTLPLPGEAAGHDIVLIAEKTNRAESLRLSAIVPDVQASKGDVTLDAVSTLTAEAVAARGKADKLADLSGSAIAVITSEVARWNGHAGLDLTGGGVNLPATFGGGLKAGSNAVTFLQGNAAIQSALGRLTDSADSDIKQARGMVQELRDMLNGIASPGRDEAGSLKTALEEQQKTISDGTKSAYDFARRVRFPGHVLGFSGSSLAETLRDKPSGRYEQKDEFGYYPLERVGDAPDGKSWIVTSRISNLTQGLVLTITPQNKIPAFNLDPTAGSMAFQVRSPNDPALQYDGALTAVKDGSGTTTRAEISITLKDAALSQPIHFTGVISGAPAAGSTANDPAYSRIAFSGSLQSPFGTASIGSLAAEWYTSSNKADLKSLRLTDLKAATAFSNAVSLSISDASVSFAAADPANGFETTTPDAVTFSAALSGSGYALRMNGLKMAFARFAGSHGDYRLAVKSAQGGMQFTGKNLSFQGDVNGSWDNPAAQVQAGMPLSQFPKASLRFTGSLTPVAGTPSSVDMTLTSGATTTGNVTLKLDRLAYGPENITGAVSAVYSVSGGNIQENPTVTAQFTHASSGIQMVYPADGHAGQGEMLKGSKKLADIGPAGKLGMSELGANTLIIKYTDNTFETAASLLP